MKQTVKYTGTRAEKMEKALQDAKSFCGEEYFSKIMKVLCEHMQKHGVKSTVKAYPMILSFTGMEGAPARAIMLEVIRRNK